MSAHVLYAGDSNGVGNRVSIRTVPGDSTRELARATWIWDEDPRQELSEDGYLIDVGDGTTRKATDGEVEGELVEGARMAKRLELAEAFALAIVRPVELEGHLWKGGLRSAESLTSAIDVAESVKDKLVLLFPYQEEQSVDHRVADARDLVNAIRSRYEVDFRVNKMAVAAIKMAGTVAAVQAIVMPTQWTTT